MWVVLFFNSALVLLLINANYVKVPLPANSPILRGPYKDFSTEWYGPVGATIAMTTVINAIMPFSNLYSLFEHFFYRCWDRRCSLDMKKTRQFLQSEYEKKYTGPEFLFASRYAVIIAMTFIIMMYSLSMPILYPCGLVVCFLTYWTDKIMFFRLYKTPPIYGLELARNS